jgi:two-component system, NtrC family, sensor histidine kinase KinB
MKTSIRSKKFTMGILLFLAIILLLSVSSAFFLYRLSMKTSAILKENHYSVVYARDLSENLTIINQEITNCILINKSPDTLLIKTKLNSFEESLQLEKNNITEIGENELVANIESAFKLYGDSLGEFVKSPKSVSKVIFLQEEFGGLYQQLMLLSQMNGKAIEVKTEDAKISAKKASIQMSVIGAICFLLAYGFTFSFSSYFNERFFQLYNGIKELVSSNYSQRLHFDGDDEFYEISRAFNEMADKLNKNKQEMSVTLHDDLDKHLTTTYINAMKEALSRVKSMEIQIAELLSRVEKR